MKHPKRWDLPKGHVDDGESNKECALRELCEETGIQEEHLRVEKGFKFKQRYLVTHKKVQKKKKLIIYLAELITDVEIVPTEHEGYEWIDWDPPHTIQEKTIDPLLAELHQWWEGKYDHQDEEKPSFRLKQAPENTAADGSGPF